MIANVGAYVLVSVLTTPTVAEQAQAVRFVDVFRHADEGQDVHLWKGTASVPDLRALLARFLGRRARRRGARRLREAARRRGVRPQVPADAALVRFAETALAGAIGGASARIMVASTVKEDALTRDEVRSMLDEASQVIAYSHELEQKSQALMAATAELQSANERLLELDRLKDDFVSTVTHELRTPLTSIRAFSEILRDNPDLEPSGAAEIPGHRDPGERAPDASHQPGARPRKARVGPRRVAGRRGRSRAACRGIDRGDRTALSRARRRARAAACARACRPSAPTAIDCCRC